MFMPRLLRVRHAIQSHAHDPRPTPHRKAHKQKKRYEAPGSLEFMHLLNALAENNEDTQAPAVKRAAAALEIPLTNRVRRLPSISSSLQMALYISLAAHILPQQGCLTLCPFGFISPPLTFYAV